jgi:uncharacterized SAM-binding protein YcdF (DUF218 family)
MESNKLTPELIAEITAVVFGPPAVKPQTCDLIFIFGGSHPGLWERAAEAYHKGLGEVILATGGYNPTTRRHPAWVAGDTPEAHVIRDELVRLGVPEGAVTIEDRSTNSLENVRFARQVYDFSRVKHILVVCKCYAVGRQCRTLAQHLDPETEILPYPFDTILPGLPGQTITRHNWNHWTESRAFMLSQTAKIYRYGNLGHLKAVENFSEALLAVIRTAEVDD